MAAPNGMTPDDDEAFQKHLKDMLRAETDDEGAGSYGHNKMSSVDLNEPGNRAATDSSVVESPFRSPVVPGHSSSPSASSPQYSGPGLTSSGAYPRPPPQQPDSCPDGGPVDPASKVMSAMSKVEQVRAQVKEFTVDTFKTTKQLVNEMLGKGGRTVDPQLDTAISDLRNLQTTYYKLLEQTNSLQSHLSSVIYTQKQLTDTFRELSLRDPKLAEDFNSNAEMQKVLIRNGEQLLGALTFFMSGMRTVCDKTMQDCLDTVKKYETARLQYDTYRTEHEQTIQSGAAGSAKTADIRHKFEERKRKYEQLKADVAVKLQFLDENKVKVVHRQMVLFHNAICAFFSGNQKQLETAMSQFNVRLKQPNAAPSSFLEQ